MRTERATSWYSWIMVTSWTSGCETRPASMLKATSAPIVMWPLKTSSAPMPMMATLISFSTSPVSDWAAVEILSTR